MTTITGGGGLTPQAIGASTTLVSGQTAVAAAGTEVVFTTAGTVTRTVIIKALATNTGNIYVGNDGTNHVASTTGLVLAAGEGVSIDIDHSKTPVYVDSAVNGEGISWIYLV